MALRTPLPPSEDAAERGRRRPGLGSGLAAARRHGWQLTTRWSPGDEIERRPPRALVAALVVAALSIVSIDHLGGDDSPVDGARRVVGEVTGPLQTAASTVVRPVGAVADRFRTNSSLREDVAALEEENAALRGEVAGAGIDRARLEEYDGLLGAAGTYGVSLVTARVVGHGAAQTFSRTVTIDAGTDSGLTEDMTVVAAEGLVGRVVSVTRSTATVLLVVDAESTVGARVGRSQEVGFLTGRGLLDSPDRVDLELVDPSVVPAAGDTVLTWGSENGGPYRAGIPIGTVTQLFSTPRDTTQRAVVETFVDFSTLDVVGVVVPDGTTGDRVVIAPDGSLG